MLESTTQSYLLELKQKNTDATVLRKWHSIVPIGIETCLAIGEPFVPRPTQSYLLELKHEAALQVAPPGWHSIVPIGIET